MQRGGGGRGSKTPGLGGQRTGRKGRSTSSNSAGSGINQSSHCDYSNSPERSGFDALGNSLCIVCDNAIIDEEEDSVQCYSCKGWEHKRCCSMKSKFNDLSSSVNLQYVCSPCIEGQKDVPTSVDGKLTALMGLLPMVSGLSKRIAKVEKCLSSDKLEATIEEIVDRKVEEKVVEALDEKIEIEKREKNIMIVNMVESDKKTVSERNAHDIQMLIELYCGKVDIESSDIDETLRLGREGKATDPPRLVKVTFKTKELRNRVIVNANSINRDLHEGVEGRRIFINPDLTDSQRDRLKLLRAELKERKNAGETDLTIRDFKIVQKKVKATNFSRGSQATGRTGDGEKPPQN